MATVKFVNVNKIYPNNVQAVFDFDLEVNNKEFIVFVGPSGCGKSTTLRMLAGLEEISSGEIYIDDVLINTVPPKDRDIAMVFQNYALYPHMSVFDNMAFSLKLRKNYFPVYKVNENEQYKTRYKRIIEENKNETLKGIEEIKTENKGKKGARKNIKEKVKDYKFRQATKLKVALKQLENEFSVPVLSYNTEQVKKLQEELVALQNSKNSKPEEIEAKREEIGSAMDEEVSQKYEYRHYTDEEIAEKVSSAAEKLGLVPYLKRKPAALSGGQRQRVALGRAIVRNPKVFLMDEPLSNLDAKLRVQMRSEIAKIHKSVGATTIYVTHDQTEAMTMASRIVCMKDGYVQQIGTPKELFNEPVNMFVASFIGSPAMNFLNGCFDGNKFLIKNENETIFSLSLNKTHISLLKNYTNKKVVLGVRPEDIYISGDKSLNNPSESFTLTCDMSELLGRELIVYSYIGGQRIIIKTNNKDDISSGDKENYVLDMTRIHFFDPETTKTIK